MNSDNSINKEHCSLITDHCSLITGVDVYLKARELVDTPYLHQGRLAGIAIDCIGVPIWVAHQLELGDFDQANYPRSPDGSMLELIKAICSPEVIQAGVLLVFEIGSIAQHCGLVSIYQDGYGLIHAWDIASKVCEHRLTRDWMDKVVGCYGLPGVVYDQDSGCKLLNRPRMTGFQTHLLNDE